MKARILGWNCGPADFLEKPRVWSYSNRTVDLPPWVLKGFSEWGYSLLH